MTAPTRDAVSGASPPASTTPPLPPPSPSSSFAHPPTSFTGLGTTQLSPDIMLRCTIFDSTGSATSTSGVFKKSRLCTEHGLEPRDLRKIDSRVPNLVPTILARRGGILVNILHIRAMIKKDKVLLFDSYGSTDSQLHSAFVYNLQHNLRPHNHHPSHGGLAYEFRALESILVSVLDALRIELGVVRSWTSGVLEELDDDVDREKLRTLLQVSRKLTAFLSRGKAVKNAVVEVLENEEDMQLMYLSEPASARSSDTASPTPSPSAPSTTDPAPDPSAMDELELLLESFDKQVEEVVAETTQLHSDITNTQEVVELILDNNRNKLLALDLKTSIATMGISAGTLWAGLFGMNLRSGMEEMDWAFGVVSGVAMGAVCLTAGVGLRRLERLRRVGLGMGKRERERRRGWGWGWRAGKREAAPGGVPVYPTSWAPDGAPQPVDHPASWPHTPTASAPPPLATATAAAGLGMGLGSKWDPSSKLAATSSGGGPGAAGAAAAASGGGAGGSKKRRKP
ncbi:related to LPE10-strong similarity to Mrs2p [Sporisorium reilianum SRZ2]|uniref:Magnesium transporter n=1 Tax=Sporisorium reilianum (strain SRZ2) TaxID=999809 RepID=E6ZNT5_SPORE|nr:related to LPE10-strong similarity to Mrs2p [Sporisorium reilianum SRZ2]